MLISVKIFLLRKNCQRHRKSDQEVLPCCSSSFKKHGVKLHIFFQISSRTEVHWWRLMHLPRGHSQDCDRCCFVVRLFTSTPSSTTNEYCGSKSLFMCASECRAFVDTKVILVSWRTKGRHWHRSSHGSELRPLSKCQAPSPIVRFVLHPLQVTHTKRCLSDQQQGHRHRRANGLKERWLANRFGEERHGDESINLSASIVASP